MSLRARHPLSRAQQVLAALLATLAVVGCTRAARSADGAPDLALDLAIDPAPARVGPAEITLTLRDPGGLPVQGAALSLRGDMAHAGMIPVLADLAEAEDGVYRAALSWTMAGDWTATIEGTLPDGRRLLRTIPLRVEPIAP